MALQITWVYWSSTVAAQISTCAQVVLLQPLPLEVFADPYQLQDVARQAGAGVETFAALVRGCAAVADIICLLNPASWCLPLVSPATAVLHISNFLQQQWMLCSAGGIHMTVHGKVDLES